MDNLKKNLKNVEKMSLNVIGPVNPKSSDLSGIIYTLTYKYKIKNPIENNIIFANSSQVKDGNINDTLLGDNRMWRTWLGPNEDVFLEFKFPNGFIYPSGYSLRWSNYSVTYTYQKEWVLYGYNDGEENKKWDVLSEDNSSEKGFCGSGEDGKCNGEGISTYTFQMPNKGYRYLRWKCNNSTSLNNNKVFMLCGIDIYGVLMTKQVIRKGIPICSCKNHLVKPNSYNFTFLIVLALIK